MKKVAIACLKTSRGPPGRRSLVRAGLSSWSDFVVGHFGIDLGEAQLTDDGGERREAGIAARVRLVGFG